jgi:hypothetical protein
MRYWDNMRTKYGFNDGGAVPDGAEIYRAVYIRAVNQLAEQLSSGLLRNSVSKRVLFLHRRVEERRDHRQQQVGAIDGRHV